MEFLDHAQVFKITDSPFCAIKNFVVPSQKHMDALMLALGCKPRRHHNNKGLRQIKNGGPEKDIRRLAKKLKIPYGKA